MTAGASSESAAGALARCREILGGEHDRFAGVWREASGKDRRLLLAMAGVGQCQAARWKDWAWGGLPAATRGDIKRGLARFRAWAGRLDGVAS